MRVIECHQYDPTWWAVRSGVPTCSAFGRILTPTGKASAARKGYACQLIAEKYDEFYSVGDEYTSEAMKEGSNLEPKARSYYEYMRDCEVREVGFCFADGDRYGGSPDGWVNEDGALECKSPLPKTHIEYVLSGKLPPVYRPQCHGHLLVTGRAWCDFQSYLPCFPALIVRVERDDYTEKLAAALTEFCDMYDEMRAKVAARLREHIGTEIDMRGAQLDGKKDAGLKAFV